MKVKRWHAIATWNYDNDNENCPICHCLLTALCISCEAEPNNAQDCATATGECNHMYHQHCIFRWLRTRSTCPLDDLEWSFT